MKDRDRYSYDKIDEADLLRLLAIARQDREDFFRAHSDWAALYADRLIATALCQGAAMHYVNGKAGINDFDVYSFYASHPQRAWYAKRLKNADFGDPKFGVSELTKPGYIGRRVDLMGRGISVKLGTDPVFAIRHFLRTDRGVTARELAKKAVVILEPEHLLGVIAWPEV